MARFTKGELEVMRILWEHGEMKPGEIQEKFPHPIKNPALRSYLTILVEKGHLARRKVGKAYYYKPITAKESAFKSMLHGLIDTFCGGSPEALMVSLVRSEKLSDKELDEIKRLADATEEEAGAKKERAR